MKLYVYDHCPFCTKARMIFGLKSLPLELSFLLEDDTATPTELIGKKVTPILQKAEGSHMAESMDIVHYLDGLQGDVLVTPTESDSPIQVWHKAAWRTILNLSIPRLGSADLPEFATAAARAAFQVRQTKNFGDFDELLSHSAEWQQELDVQLRELDALLAGREQIDADDFTLYPSLRMLSIVKGVQYPVNVTRYMERMAVATAVPLYTEQAR